MEGAVAPTSQKMGGAVAPTTKKASSSSRYHFSLRRRYFGCAQEDFAPGITPPSPTVSSSAASRKGPAKQRQTVVGDAAGHARDGDRCNSSKVKAVLNEQISKQISKIDPKSRDPT